MELGSKVHKGVENYHKGIAQDLDEILPHKKWDYTLKSFLSPYSEYYLPEHHDSIEGYVEAKIERNSGALRSLPIPLLGKIDRIWQKIPHDLKTSAGRYREDAVNEMRQPWFYIYLIYKDKGYIPDRFIYDVLVKNKTPKVQILEVPVTPEKMWENVDYIFNTWEEMKVAEMPEFHADYCRNKNVLP